MPSAARPALDFEAFFGRMYHRGVPYVDYLDGLSLDPAAIASILRAVGADPDLTDADVADLGKRIAELGITPAIGQFIPSLLVDMLVRTYPTLYPSVETMEDYEDLAPAGTVRIGATDWNGWSLNGGEVNVLLSEGHSAGGVVFHVPDHRFLMMADETTSIPIWADSDPRNAVATAQRALAMMDAGDLDVLAAGHRPLLPVRGDEARACCAASSGEVPGMILTGFGLGLTMSPTNTDALSRVAAEKRSQASGVLQTVRQLGGTLGVAVVGAVVLGIEHRGTQGSDVQAAADAITAGFAVSTAAFAVALLVAARLLARERVAADPATAAESLA